MRRFLNLTTLKNLAKKRQKPGDVIVGAGAVLGLWTLLYTLLGFAVNLQHLCEVLIGIIAPAFLIIRCAQKPSNDTSSSVLPSVARFALSGVAIGVVGILIAVWWLEGSPTVLAGMVGIVIGALASLPGAVAVLFAADLVRYYISLQRCAIAQIQAVLWSSPHKLIRNPPSKCRESFGIKGCDREAEWNLQCPTGMRNECA